MPVRWALGPSPSSTKSPALGAALPLAVTTAAASASVGLARTGQGCSAPAQTESGLSVSEAVAARSSFRARPTAFLAEQIGRTIVGSGRETPRNPAWRHFAASPSAASRSRPKSAARTSSAAQRCSGTRRSRQPDFLRRQGWRSSGSPGLWKTVVSCTLKFIINYI